MHTSVPTRKALTRAPALTATPQMTMEGIAMVRIMGGGGKGRQMQFSGDRSKQGIASVLMRMSILCAYICTYVCSIIVPNIQSIISSLPCYSLPPAIYNCSGHYHSGQEVAVACQSR